MTAPLLSVAIITHNEQQNLPRTLRSVHFADEIIVVDSGSTDATVKVARSFNATVIERAWHGFAAQKNFAIAQCTGEWILALDADEELSAELQQEILSLISANPEPSNSDSHTPDAFFLCRRNLFLGRWIRHSGFYPDPKLRLFRRNLGGATLQFEARPVHETITYAGPTATLRHDLIHHAYPTLATYIEHMDRYSTLGAEILITKRRSSSALLAFLCNVLFMPVLSFKWNYIARGGFLDGREGLLLNLYQAVYTSWKYAKAWEQSRGSTSEPVAKPWRPLRRWVVFPTRRSLPPDERTHP